MVESDRSWPQARLENVDPDWWNEVMSSTAGYNSYFSPELSDTDDFTIRAIVHVVSTEPRERVSWIFENSTLQERLLQIHDLLSDDGKKREGIKAVADLIKDYTSDVLDSS